jgi:ATP/maltotriose-dependent transcriptional regulator MalT/DNA-binding SARP family transcriptional activator
MARMDPILRHSITPPVFDEGKIHRERLVDGIHANIPRKLVVIATPPGYGKTTLAADFTEHTDLPVCWVRLTEADQDVMRLVRVLEASLAKRFRRLRGNLDLDAFVGSKPEGLARAFAEVIEKLIDEPFVILMDDVHLVNNSQGVLRFLDGFLEVQPEQVTLVIFGREVPEVALAKLMAEGNLAGFGPHDLALNESELKQLAAEIYAIELSDQSAGELLEETRGWVTGVLLSAKLGISRDQSWLDRSRPMVFEYLASVVLNRQPDEIRRFMLDTSVMPVMTVASCNSVLERKDSERYLRRLLKEGLFVTATGEGPRTYEYHPQFREFLLDVLQNADARRLGLLRRRAGQYLADQGLIEHAVDLYLEAESVRKAVVLAEQHARSMYVDGRFKTLETWGRKLKEHGKPSPSVFLFLALEYSNQGRQDAAYETLNLAKDALSSRKSKELLAQVENVRGQIAYYREEFEEAIVAAEKALALVPTQDRWGIRAMSMRIKSLALAFGQGEFEKAEELAANAVSLLEESENEHALAAALIDLSSMQAQRGRMIASNVTSNRAHEILVGIGSPLPLAMSYNNLAFDAHMQGRYEEALSLYGEALKQARLAGAPVREATVLFGQADIFNDLGLALQAAELYAQGLMVATSLENESLIRYGAIQTSVLHRRRGGNTLGMEWVKRAIEHSKSKVPSTMIQIQLGALEAIGSPKSACERLAALFENASQKHTAAEKTLAHFFMALALFENNKMREAKAEISECLLWASGHGTEQVLAAELMYQPSFLDNLKNSIEENPAFSLIQQRIDTMQALAGTYREPKVERSSSVEIELIAFGQTRVLRDGEAIGDLSPASKELLFYLIDNKRIDRDVLIETFWPDYPPGRQTSNLHTAVYSLRRAIGKDTVLSDGSAYFLSSDFEIEYDVGRFENAAEVAEGLAPGDPRKLFALTEAINTYTGPYMPEFSSNWIIDRRRLLEMRYLDLAANYADEALLRDQPTRAVNALRAALKMDPYRDDLNLRILEVLGRLGRRSEIVAHYQRYVRLLSDELGLDPPQIVRDTYTRLIG